MSIGHTSLIFSFVFCEYCILMTWSAGNEDNQNLPLAEKGKSQREYFPKSPGDVRMTAKQKEDEKGRRLASESSSSESGSTSEGKLKKYNYWSNEQREDVLRHFYSYQLMGAYKGPNEVRDWVKITNAWIKKHGNVKEKNLRNNAYFLREKMLDTARKFDDHYPNGIGFPWTEWLNDDLMKVYYATEKGPISRHGERMRDMWRLAKYPGYERVKAEYLLNRAEAMLEKARKLTPEELRIAIQKEREKRRESAIFMGGGTPNWNHDHDKYLLWLWEWNKGEKEEGGVTRIYTHALWQFPEFKDLTARQVYERARYMWNREQKRKRQEAAAEHEAVQKSHVQYDKFIDNEKIPFLYHEWMPGTTSHSGPNYQQPN